MAYTYATLLVEAREILQDTATDATLQRYTDTVLLNHLNRGLQELYRLRPDAFYDFWSDAAEDFVVPLLDTSALPSTTSYQNPFALPYMFYDPLVNWVIGSTEAIDDEFSEDSRSTMFRNAFKMAVIGL